MSKEKKILIAGIGNIFMGDDAFGSEVARALMKENLPENVRVVDFGIRGLDLAYTLLDGLEDVTILVDATPRGGDIGTLYTIEPDLKELDENLEEQAALDPHGMNPLKILAMVKSMGGELKKIFLVGCEPEMLKEGEEKMGMNEVVEMAVGEAVKIVKKLVENILNENCQTAVV